MIRPAESIDVVLLPACYESNQRSMSRAGWLFEALPSKTTGLCANQSLKERECEWAAHIL
jgi:hypothetical protein